MSFQRRVTLASAAAVAVAVAIASLATYVLVRNDLHRHINHSLHDARGRVRAGRAQLSPATPGRRRAAVARPQRGAGARPTRIRVLLRRFPGRPGDSTNVVQLVTASGATYPAFDGERLALREHDDHGDRRARRAAAPARGLFDATAHGSPLRVLAAGVSPGYAVVVSHSLTEANSTLNELRPDPRHPDDRRRSRSRRCSAGSSPARRSRRCAG